SHRPSTGSAWPVPGLTGRRWYLVMSSAGFRWMVCETFQVACEQADLSRNILFIQHIFEITQDRYHHIYRQRGPATLRSRVMETGSIVACAAIGLGCGQAAARRRQPSIAPPGGRAARKEPLTDT